MPHAEWFNQNWVLLKFPQASTVASFPTQMDGLKSVRVGEYETSLIIDAEFPRTLRFFSSTCALTPVATINVLYKLTIWNNKRLLAVWARKGLELMGKMWSMADEMTLDESIEASQSLQSTQHKSITRNFLQV